MAGWVELRSKMALVYHETLLFVLICCFSSVFSANNGLGLVPPMGWNSWCTLGKCFTDYCNAGEVMTIADTIVNSGMKDLGYTYVNLDDCWADYRDDQGNIVPDFNRFPGGLEPVIQYLNSKGLKFGLYTDSGFYTCSSGGRNHKIPGSYGHYAQDAATYAKWGVEYVKMDWCNTRVNGAQLDPHIVYKNMSIALNQTGKQIWLNSCEWGVDNPWEWIGEFANSWRTGQDHHDVWDDSKFGTATIIEHNADLGKYAGPGGWNDPDFLFTGGQGCDPPIFYSHCPGQSDTEYRTEFSIWCLMAAPLLVATDIRNMTDIMKTVLFNKELIAVDQDPLGHAGGRIGYSDCPNNTCQIWSKDLKDGSKAVGLYNSGNFTSTITLDFGKYFNWSSVTMRDLWAFKDLGVVNKTFSVDVAGHGIEVYKITKS